MENDVLKKALPDAIDRSKKAEEIKFNKILPKAVDRSEKAAEVSFSKILPKATERSKGEAEVSLEKTLPKATERSVKALETNLEKALPASIDRSKKAAEVSIGKALPEAVNRSKKPEDVSVDKIIPEAVDRSEKVEEVNFNKLTRSEESNYNIVRTEWKGLNKANTIDSGYLSDVSNISMAAFPYLETAPEAAAISSDYASPIVSLSIHGFGDFLLVVYRDGTNVKCDYIKGARKWTGVIKAGATSADDIPRSIIQFNLYDTPSDPLSGTFVKKLIVYPDKLSFDYEMDETAGVTTFTPASLDASPNVTPALKYACVYLSRVFGVDDDRIYASGFNDYSLWDLDTAEESLSSNAWVSTAQSNVKAGNDFTGIIAFGGTVVAFKKDFMHEIYNNKNPFRVGDIYAEGAIDNRSIQDVDGRLIFISSDGVKQYTGGNPAKIGTPLGINSWTSGIAGARDNTYYVYNGNVIYTYNVDNGSWSALSAASAVIGFASNESGIYTLCADGIVRKLDTTDYSQTWYLETDLSMASSLDPKRLKKLQLMADIGTGASIKAYELTDNETFNANTSQLLLDSGTKIGRQILRCAIRMTSGESHRIRITGTGYVKLYSMELKYAQGGEAYV